MDLVVLGIIAGILTSSSFVPQIVRGWRTRRLGDVSPWMLGAMMSGLSLWLAYGVLRGDAAIVFANALGLALSTSLMAMWWRFGRPGR